MNACCHSLSRYGRRALSAVFMARDNCLSGVDVDCAMNLNLKGFLCALRAA